MPKRTTKMKFRSKNKIPLISFGRETVDKIWDLFILYDIQFIE